MIIDVNTRLFVFVPIASCIAFLALMGGMYFLISNVVKDSERKKLNPFWLIIFCLAFGISIAYIVNVIFMYCSR